MTDSPVLPRYPVYIPSKGRWDQCLTAKFLDGDGVPFRLVVEPHEADRYSERFGAERVLTLPFRDAGSVVPARCWIMDHAIAEGHERHWQLDDNMARMRRRYRGKRIPCEAGPALRIVEDFTDRYENVAISGIAYSMFVPDGRKIAPFFLNVHVYSCCLFLNSMPYRWRGRYNEDTDICLQALSGGWCTVLVNAFTVDKARTMTMKGGNTSELYQGDGRLRMARALERNWPGVVRVMRRWKRPQHYVQAWGKQFDTPLRLKPGISLDDMPAVDEHGMRLTEVESVRSSDLLSLVADRLEADRKP